MGVKFDFKKIIENQMIEAVGKSDPRYSELFQIFRKYDLELFDGLAMLSEIATLFSKGDAHD